jgi:hypothetical protein
MAWFEWSTGSTFATFTATPAQSVGAGMALVPYAAAVTGFPFEVPLYMRAVASSAGGVSRGAVVRFR